MRVVMLPLTVLILAYFVMVGGSGQQAATKQSATQNRESLLDRMDRLIEESRIKLEKKFNDAMAIHSKRHDELERKVKRLEIKIESLLKNGIQSRSCGELLRSNPFLPSGMYWIDPDGHAVGDEPIHVYCDMINGATSILHNTETTIDVAQCRGPGCYSRDIHYNATMRQLVTLIELSANCSQSITYDCNDAPLVKNGVTYSWWNDRNGNIRTFWSGSGQQHTCQCGIDGNCIDPDFLCNCNSLKPQNLSDFGIITKKDYLPITRLKFGRTHFSKLTSHTLGRLNCSGHVVVNDLPKSCNDLRLIGHRLSGLYSLKGNDSVIVVYCDFNESKVQHLVNEEFQKDILGRMRILDSNLKLVKSKQDSLSMNDVRFRTCDEMRRVIPKAESEYYWIDPDGLGVGDDPIHVYCNTTSGATLIGHDADEPITVNECSGPGCYSRNITYNASMKQIKALMMLSDSCWQRNTFDCTKYAPSLNYTWFLDRNGDRIYVGNCKEFHERRKLKLPFIRLVFGGVTASFQVKSGNLACFGQEIIGEPKSCGDLWLAGHVMSGFYLIKTNDSVTNEYCNFTRGIKIL